MRIADFGDGEGVSYAWSTIPALSCDNVDFFGVGELKKGSVGFLVGCVPGDISWI